MLMDPSGFMLASLSMTDSEYALWGPGMTYVNWLREELDYDEFNYTRLKLSLIVEVLLFSSHLFHSYFLLLHSWTW